MAAIPISKRITSLVATEQGKSYTVAAVTLFLLLIMIAFGIFPVVSAVFTGIESNAVKTELLAEMKQKQQIVRGLIVEESEKHAVSLALEAALPDDMGQVKFLNDLDSLANSTGTTINILNFGALDTKRELKIIFNLTSKLKGSSVSLSVAGTRSSLEKFIAGLEQMRRIVNIQAFAIAKVDEDGTKGAQFANLFKIDIQAEIYYGLGS
ncbi:type 4a pilus biogenesis protein PilO [Candidatus Dojkabacteria bacterium]|uniref:Type 4a pilus biogenesis protein PilO n=1 Tax=Candidatus Dojkabacteria bacterium TaxID=2099670 RepID=A0A955I613_9BACT|nr:type 4a pilus biogenesis protein PilO [Candidatus Dojkabacteria bacterium]